jgi:ABC-type multidrug transport system fused ATPase/permease subunit
MTDVEGVRNLVGTGLVEFLGGMLTAILAFIYLLHRSVTVTLTVFSVLGVFVFVLQYAFRIIRPIFRERGRINAEVTGRLTESLGGVRVIKGYHAEDRHRLFRRRGAAFGERHEVADHDQRAYFGIDNGSRPGFGAGDVAGRAQRAARLVDRG